MGTRVTLGTVVVNMSGANRVDRGTHDLHYVHVLTLKDRLEWVLKNRPTEVGNKSQWSLKAGLSRKQVDQLMRRGDATNEGRVELWVLEALARVAGVSPVWLAFGVDDPALGALWFQVRERPALYDTIMADPGRWFASTVTRALSLPFKSNESAEPEAGWRDVLDRLQRGEAVEGDATEAQRIVALKSPLRRLPKGA
jgi:hypothetical protein